MKAYTSSNVLEELTKITGKWGLYIKFDFNNYKLTIDEIKKNLFIFKR